MRLAGDIMDDVDEHGDRIVGDTLLLLLNAHHEAIPFTLPPQLPEQCWELLVDTANMNAETEYLEGGQQYLLQGRSLVLLRTVPRKEEPLLTSKIVVAT
jgi:glycogen operon protein